MTKAMIRYMKNSSGEMLYIYTRPTLESAKTASFTPGTRPPRSLSAPALPKPAKTGFCPVGQTPLPLALAQPRVVILTLPLWHCQDRALTLGDGCFPLVVVAPASTL